MLHDEVAVNGEVVFPHAISRPREGGFRCVFVVGGVENPSTLRSKFGGPVKELLEILLDEFGRVVGYLPRNVHPVEVAPEWLHPAFLGH